MSTKLSRILLAATVVLCSSLAPIQAQFTTASLGGVIADATGSAVPSAKVTVQNRDTALTRTASSADDGSYLFPLLPVGAYRLTIEKAGFSGYVQDGIVLNVSQAATQNVTLQLGAISQQVSVSSDA